MTFSLPYLVQRPVRAERLGAPSTEILSLARELEQDVRILASDIGPRGYFLPKKYALAEQFLTSSLMRTGYDVTKEPTECCDNSIAHNLIVEINGTTNPERVFVAGAHYDSVEDCPAANDNGSGVAGLLALARRLVDEPCASTIRLVLFANEEPPHFNMNAMGSQHHARECKKRGEQIEGMFCFETIGCYSQQRGSQQWPHPLLAPMLGSVGNFIAFVGPPACKSFLQVCVDAFARSEAFSLIGAAAEIEQVHLSDHRGFIDEGFPAFMITDTAPLRYPHYHLPTDTAEKLDYVSMARVVQGTLTMLKAVAN